MSKWVGFVKRLWLGEEGATMLEYALMIAFVAIACVTAISALGVSLRVPFQHAINGLS